MKKKLMLLLTYLFLGIGLVTAQTQSITGVVISEEDGQPVVGASVLVIGTNFGTTTDVDGKFTLTNVPYIGMQAEEVATFKNLNTQLEDINLYLQNIIGRFL